jgi:chromate transporter
VVGVLGAALYNPVWTTSVKTPADFAVALVEFVLLVAWRAPPLLVVTVSALGGVAPHQPETEPVEEARRHWKMKP